MQRAARSSNGGQNKGFFKIRGTVVLLRATTCGSLPRRILRRLEIANCGGEMLAIVRLRFGRVYTVYVYGISVFRVVLALP
jgi:hypothetical protein